MNSLTGSRASAGHPRPGPNPLPSCPGPMNSLTGSRASAGCSRAGPSPIVTPDPKALKLGVSSEAEPPGGFGSPASGREAGPCGRPGKHQAGPAPPAHEGVTQGRHVALMGCRDVRAPGWDADIPTRQLPMMTEPTSLPQLLPVPAWAGHPWHRHIQRGAETAREPQLTASPKPSPVGAVPLMGQEGHQEGRPLTGRSAPQ